MEIIQKVITCVNCYSILDSPVVLPCGHSICKKHANQTEKNTSCGMCGIDHLTPSIGFTEDIILGYITKCQIAYFDEEKKKCDNLHQQIDNLLKDPASFTYEEINEIRNQIQLKGEGMKKRIDEEMDHLFEKSKIAENEIKTYLSSNEFSVKSQTFREELNKSQSKIDCWFDHLMK